MARMDEKEGHTAARLWAGAREAVSAFIAEAAARRLLTRQPAATLRIRPSGIDVLREEAQRTELLLTASGRPQEAIASAAERLSSGLGRDCAVEFAAGLAVTTAMVLPAENQEILNAIIRNKVESIAPWPLAQSLYGYRIAPIAGDPAHVSVSVAVVSRALLEEIAARLAAGGSIVKTARVRLSDEETLAIGFGAEEGLREAERRARRIGLGFVSLAALVAGFGLFLVWQSTAELSADAAEIQRLIASLQQTDAVEGGTPLLAAANTLHERRRERLPAIAVLNELSGLLPQNVWLDSVTLDDTKLEIKGEGAGIPPLIEILERSAAFRDVNFSAATQRNAEMTAEAFSIEATLEKAPAAEASQ